MRAELSDLRTIADVYPVPADSVNALKLIFPDAVALDDIRKTCTLASKNVASGKLDINMVVSMLSFWQQQRGGKINYLEDVADAADEK